MILVAGSVIVIYLGILNSVEKIRTCVSIRWTIENLILVVGFLQFLC